MRYYSCSKSFEISLGLSILLHICIFVFIKSPKPFKKIEPSPISVEYLSAPKKQLLSKITPATEKVPQPEVNRTRTESPEGSVVSQPETTVSQEPAERTASEGGKEPVQFPYMRQTELPEAPVKPNLFSFREQPAKIEEEKISIGVDGFKEEETISLQAPDLRYESYVRGVLSKIEGVWKYPETAIRAKLEGSGVIVFTLNRQGELIDVKILRPSEFPILDGAIIDAVKKAALFNPFQENMPVKLLHIEATFEYHLISQGSIWIR